MHDTFLCLLMRCQDLVPAAFQLVAYTTYNSPVGDLAPLHAWLAIWTNQRLRSVDGAKAKVQVRGFAVHFARFPSAARNVTKMDKKKVVLCVVIVQSPQKPTHQVQATTWQAPIRCENRCMASASGNCSCQHDAHQPVHASMVVAHHAQRTGWSACSHALMHGGACAVWRRHQSCEGNVCQTFCRTRRQTISKPRARTGLTRRRHHSLKTVTE